MIDETQPPAQTATARTPAMAGTGLESFASSPQYGQLTDGGLARALDPAEIFRILQRWKYHILAALILGPLIALGVSLMMTPMYVAASQLQINQEDQMVIKGADSARPVMINNSEFLATQIGLLKSRDLAQRVVDAQRLANKPDFASQTKSAGERREDATDQVLRQMTIEEVRNSRLVNIKITSPDPAMATQLANSYAEQFIASGLDRDFEATSFARKFLEDRIGSTRSKLEETESALVNYAARQGIVELGSDEKGASKQSLEASTLIMLNTALAQARADRIIAEQRSVHSASNSATAAANSNPALQEMLRKRAEAQAEYQEKLATFLPGLPAMIALNQRIKSFDGDIRRMQGGVGNAALLDFRAAAARERELQQRVDGMKSKVLDLRSRSIQYTILQRDVDTNRALYEALLQKYKEVGVAGGVGANKVSVVDRARVPVAPVSPNVLTNVLIGLLLGAFVGLCGVFFLEFVDDTIKVPEDVNAKLRMTLLGVLPMSSGADNFMEAISDPKSDLMEAAHSMRTSLQFATGHGMPRSLLITSSRPGEGKSSVASALAISLSRFDKKVLILDADLRKPSFYVGNTSRNDTIGLSNVLSGELQLEAVTRQTIFKNLSVVPAGHSVPNPAALLSEGGFAALLKLAISRYDHVIIDGPPVIGLADAPLIGSVVEGAVMVVEAANVNRSTVLASASRMLGSNTRLVGVVLNKFDSLSSRYGDGYAYSYNYGDEVKTDEDSEDRKIVLVK